MISLNELRETYGDFSAEGIINRWESFPFGENNFKHTPEEKFFQSSEPVQKNFVEPSQNDEFIEPERKSRFIGGSVTQNYFPSSTPQSVQKNKFSPVNIASLKDWAELRAEALDLHELKNFFVGKNDSQSPQFINLIDNYKKSVEKNLINPQETDEDSSNVFVEKLADVIEKRFYTILKSCERGKLGRGEMSKDYYLEMEKRIKKYFDRVGLNSENVKRGDPFQKWQEHMKILATIPAPYDWLNKKISEVEIQPHYFEYHGDDGEIEKFYIDGECTVYKFSS